MAIDEVQQVAQARASMMVRGFTDLALEVGPDFARALAGLSDPDGVIFSMPVTVSRDMEGFHIRPRQSRS